MNKKIYLKLLIVFVCFISFSVNVSAKTLAQFKKELSDAEAKYSKNQSDKHQTEEEISATKAKINSITNEKHKISADVENLNKEITQLADDIKKMKGEINELIHYYQLSSSGSLYLEYVFNASNFTDFIYRLAISEQLSEYREKTIDEYNNLVEKNKNKLSELATKQASLNKLESELSVELGKLDEDLSEIAEVSIDIKKEISELKSQINTYQNKYKCKDNEEISNCIARNNNSSSGGSSGNIGAPSANGFYRPVTAGRINANFGYTDYYGSFHDGMDIGVSHGTTVYSIANGYVARISYKQSCGGNMIYIVHNVGGKKYTSGYFHLASINVSVGQVVTPNTVIGYSGGAPSIETWDRCSTGAHLHLQLGTGAYMSDYFFYSNYAARKFDPRQLINFPAMGSYFSGR